MYDRALFVLRVSKSIATLLQMSYSRILALTFIILKVKTQVVYQTHTHYWAWNDVGICLYRG